MSSFTTINELRVLNDEELLAKVSKMAFLDGSCNKDNIKEIFKFLYNRHILPIDFFIYFLNTNNIHLNETQYLRDLIACDFLNKNLIRQALEFKPANEINCTLNILIHQETQEFNSNDISMDFFRFKIISDFLKNIKVESTFDKNYEFLSTPLDDLSMLNLLNNVISESEKMFFEDKTLFLLFKLKRVLKERILVKISYSYCSYTLNKLVNNFGEDSVNLMRKLIYENKISAVIEEEIMHFN